MQILKAGPLKIEGLVILLVTFLGWLSDLLERLSDLQLGDEKVTLNHLGWIFFGTPNSWGPHPQPPGNRGPNEGRKQSVAWHS